MKISTFNIKIKYQIIFFLVFIFSIIFLISKFEMQKEKFGYKKDYLERNRKITEEIPIIIKPYQISKISSVQQGPLSIRNFYIEGTWEDYQKIHDILEKKSMSIGFNGVCRDEEVIWINFDEVSKPNHVVIQWKYPDESCSKP